ncbi:MAG: uncharacterized protein JWM27_4730 [Gemmatimonadetes bacterium]|nr:uncharacterized protein [Gemmatimonadota bacterium]
MTALWPLQVALHERLAGDAGVSALVGQRVFDGLVPTGAALPYVVTGEGTATPYGVLGRAGSTDTITLHVWSAYCGSREVLAIVDAIDAALRLPLVIDGHLSARLRQDFATVLVDTTGDTTLRHAPVRYRIITSEAP